MGVVIRPRVEMFGEPLPFPGALWSFDEASGTRVDDSGEGNDLADNNTVTQAAGNVGDAAQFTAANSEYLSHADSEFFETGDVHFAFAAWVYLDSKAQHRPIVTKYSAGVRGYALFYNSATDRFAFWASPDGSAGYFLNADSLGSPSTGTWYFVQAWHDPDADTLNIQIDDGAVDSLAFPDGGVFEESNDFWVGKFYPTNSPFPDLYYMDGRIDGLVFLKGYAITADDRTFLYNGGSGRTSAEIFDYFSPSGWVDISEDVVSPVKCEWGIHSSTPTDRIAESGSMEFLLDNSGANSARTRGYYSIGHEDARPGFAIGAPIRLILSHPTFGDKEKWTGTIEDALAAPGVRSPTTAVRCADWMEQALRAKLSGLEVQTDIQSDDVFNLLAAVVPTQPPNGILFGTGADVYPYALDNVQDEKSTVYGELSKLAMSEYGLIYVQAGVLVFEGRSRRGGAGSVRWAFDEDEDIVAMAVTHGRDAIINRAQVSVHPRRRDSAATSVLFSLGSALQIPRNTTVTINAPYRDPDQRAQRVGGIDMVDPVAAVDYTFTENEDGTGSDLTAQMSVVATFGGNSATLAITNAGPYDGFVPASGLQLRGRGLYDFEPMVSDQKDQASIDIYGENNLPYDMPYQSDPNNAIDLAQFILSLNAEEDTRVDAFSFVGNWSDQHAELAFNLEISDRVSVTAGTLGVEDRPHYINGFKLEVRMNGVVIVTPDLSPVDTNEYWILGVEGRSELGETTVLGFGLFAPAWILETSELGTDTYLGG